MRIATLLYLTEVDVNLLHLQLLFLTEDTQHVQAFITLDDRNVTVFQIHHLIGIFHNRTGIRADEELTVADTHHQRALLTGSHDLIGITLVEHGDGVGTNHLIECHLNGLQQRQVLFHHHIFYQLYQHLGVGIADKLHTLGPQFLLDIGIVLDDAVVDDGQIVRLRVMGMGISRRRLTMRSPAGMGDADGSAHILVAAILTKIIHLALCLIDIQFTVGIDHRHTG